MKKSIKVIFIVILLGLASSTQVRTQTIHEQSWEIATGADILVFVGGGSTYSYTADLFYELYTTAGNNVTVVSDYDFASEDIGDYDAILLTNFEVGFNAANLTAFKEYVELGNKLLWVAGNSDFSEFYKANNTANPVLEAVASNLRIDGGQIEDYASNDDASYRVIANETGVSSTAVDYVTDGFLATIYHGPTGIAYYDYNQMRFEDLRNQSIVADGIDIYINTSEAATSADAGSLSDYDVYPYLAESGNYPMLASQQLNGSVVVTSGEASFTDYKEMYDWHFEFRTTEDNDGIVIVDRMLSYWLTDIGMNFAGLTFDTTSRPNLKDTSTNYYTATETLTETNTETEISSQTQEVTVTETVNGTVIKTEEPVGLPISTIALLTGLISIPLLFRKRR